MLEMVLEKVKHDFKVGDSPPDISPNVPDEDLLFIDGETGEQIGFYIKNLDKQTAQLLRLVNNEFLSDRVPKTLMERSSIMAKQRKEGITRKEAISKGVSQLSTILGMIPKKPNMMRNYTSVSSVNRVESANLFIAGMLKLALKSEECFKSTLPSRYDEHVLAINSKVPSKYFFGGIFTSTISNFNIAAKNHVDTKNVKGCYNFIYNCKHKATGGNLYIPDYGVCLNSSDSSLICYPAWRNMHGVTEIVRLSEDGYRNSHIFYVVSP